MRKIFLAILLSALYLAGNAQVFNIPGNYTWTPPVGTSSYSVTIWGGGGAGSVTSGGGGTSYTRSKYFNLNSTSSPVQFYVGRGGYNSGNPSSNGENSWVIAPSGFVVNSGYGLSDGTTFMYPADEVYRDVVKPGGKGGLACQTIAGGGGGSSPSSSTSASNGTDASNCSAGLNAIPGTGGISGIAAGGNGSGRFGQVPATNGGNPGGGGGGIGFNTGVNVTGGNGMVVFSVGVSTGHPGSIIIPYTVPYPRESKTDSIRSMAHASGYNPGGTGIIYRWEFSLNGTNWNRLPGTNTGASCKIPEIDSIGYYYRRIATNVPYPDTISNSVKLKVFSTYNANNTVPSKNGSISGKVVSKSGAGVAGIRVFAQKLIDLKSSPRSHIDSVETVTGGFYQFSNLYYGDKDAPNNDPVQVPFKVWPAKPLHSFDPDTIPILRSFSNYAPNQSIDFTDTTVLSVTGRIFQQCNGCLNENNVMVNTITAGVDSAKITGGDIPVYSLVNGSGNYEASVANAGSKTFVPSFSNHQFNPASRQILVNSNISNLNFEDTSTRTISGRLTDGGGDSIGIAVLEFTDTVRGRSGYVFRKRVITKGNGDYEIRLPARSYRVEMISFTSHFPSGNPRSIESNDIGKFFNKLLPKDSLIRNIDSANKILNLVYRRIPFITATPLEDTTCNKPAGVVFFQNRRRPFTIKVFEGDPLIGHPIFTLDSVKAANELSIGDSVMMITDLLDQSGKDPNQTFKMRLTAGKVDTAITAGVPNIIAPYNRKLDFNYTDRYGRVASTLSKKTTTVGVLSPPQTFVTVAPEIPQLILHRPPGDQSYSFWEQTKTVQNVQRLSVSNGSGVDAFAEVKVGAAFSAGIGIQIETSIKASINTSISTTSTNINENELLFSNATTTKYSTKAGGIAGSAGDVYIGGAMNYNYGVSSVLAIQNVPSSCPLELSDKLIVAPFGYATTFTYSEDHIKNRLMPELNFFVANTTGPQQAYYQNQLNVWQQVLDNNEYQKANAEFKENRSFDGSAGGVEVSETFTKSSVNTLTYNLEIDKTVAGLIDVEVNGTGISGGVTVQIKSETGKSTQNTVTTETTTGYYLSDANAGDYYSVDIKRDKVYGTPVFDLVAGTSSCPPEPVAQSRDFPRIIIDTPIYNNIPNNIERFFNIKVVNLSQSRETRSYRLNVNNSTSNGLVITTSVGQLGGVLYHPVNNLPYGEVRNIIMSVRKFNPNDNEFSWSDIELNLTDDCGGGVEAVNYFSANFVTTCSGIEMDEPADNWKSTATDQNIIPVAFSGYNAASVDSVVVQYSPIGKNDWKRGLLIPGFQISNTGSTQVPWNVSTLPDSMYKVRLQMHCSGGVKFTTSSVSGVLDRKAPGKVGKPQPANDAFVNGNEISFTYNEKLNADNLSKIKVSLIKMPPGTGTAVSEAAVSNAGAASGTPIPASFSVFDKKLTVVPLNDISQFTGDNFMVVVSGVTDAIGNSSIISDTSFFKIEGANPIGNAPSVKLYTVEGAKKEDSLGTMQIRFRLPANATRVTKVFYSISGSASFGDDYTVTTDTIQRLVRNRTTNLLVPVPVFNSFNGSNGFIYIDSLKREAILRIKPSADKITEGDETIVVNLLSGGDYTLGDSTQAIVTILNDDALVPLVDSSGPLSLCGDSVLLTAKPMNAVQFASSVVSYSSQQSNMAGAASKILGIPDVFPTYGAYGNTWIPATPDNVREFIEIGFNHPTPINFVDIYETHKPGSIDTVFVKNPNTGLYDVVYTNTAVSLPDAARKLRISFPTTSFAVSTIRLAMASSAVPGKNAIDAVAIGDSTPYVSYLWTPSGATTQSIWVKTAGKYAVKVTAANAVNGYSDTANVKSSGVSGTLLAGPPIPAICPGSSSIILGGSFTGGITSAIWSDGGAGGNFSNNIGADPGAVLYTASPSANGNIILKLTTQACATSVSKTVVVNGETTWLGKTNNWNDETNWMLGKVPFNCTVVHIMPGTLNTPVISGTNNSCKMLDVKPGATIMLEPGAILNVTGN